MINNILNEAINSIDDDLISNAHSNNSSKKSYKKYLAIAAVFSIVIMAVVFGNRFDNKPTIDTGINNDNTTSTNGDACGIVDTYEKISDNTIEFIGTAYTKEEIWAFVEKNKYNIVNVLAAEYNKFDSVFNISTVGYIPVSLGKKNTLSLEYITLPITTENNIIATVTLFKTENGIEYSIETGSDNCNNLHNALYENKNSELAFFYFGGYTEVAISPDNTKYIIKGNKSVLIDENINYYKKFVTDYNVFSFKSLSDENNYISVKPLQEEVVTAKNLTDSAIHENNNTQCDTTVSTQKTLHHVSVDNILSENVSKVEWSNGYYVLMEQPYKQCTNKQEEKILAYISDFELIETNISDIPTGGGWNVKIHYEDGSFVEIVLLNENCIYIVDSDGHSPFYTDDTENAKNLINYMVSFVN